MPSAEPYTPDVLLEELHTELDAWLRANKGSLSVAGDPYNFLELLTEAPGGFRVVLHWAGEENPSDLAEAGVFAPQKLELGITANLGLTASPEQTLFKASAVRPALLQIVAKVRDWMRGYTFPDSTTTRYLHYKGCDPVSLPDGVPLRAFRLRFEITLGLPEAIYRNLR